MDILNINLENCYGIQKLNHQLSFEAFGNALEGSTFSIYAPNGFMKTSLARTFLDIQEGRESQDLVFPDRTTIRKINFDQSTEINPESIFVIKPYVERYVAKGTSTLLVNSKLKEEYENAVKNIEDTQNELMGELKKLSQWPGRSLPTNEIKEVFQYENSYEFFEDIAKNLDGNEDFSDLNYSEIFNEKTIFALKAGTLHKQLKEYIEKYQELVDNSPVLSKKFNHTSASDVSRNLLNNGFFDAKHSVNISNGTEKLEITSAKDLDELVKSEKERILGDKDLSDKFEAIDKLLQRNAELKRFREYLSEHPEILPELGNYNDFRKKLWNAYFNKAKLFINSFSLAYSHAKDVISKTAQQAKDERTKWTIVVAKFNERFYVPFKLTIQNQHDVILKGEAPNICFEFDDGYETCGIDEEKLLQVLSQGERRALYILNILFEIEARIESKQPTLLIIDDIADSFDYKNKYAIVEYLNEISKFPFFRLIFLTHNFDFHRTISSRLQINRERRLFAKKYQGYLSFIVEKYQNDPFVTWKKNLNYNPAYLVASIPFVRNLAEYCHGNKSKHYLALTSLLHIRDDSSSLTIQDLENIYKATLLDQAALTLPDPGKSVIQLIYEQADLLINSANDHVELESKIILSIAIRLQAESFMINKINDANFVRSITSNQTLKLFERYTSLHQSDNKNLPILGQVNLMTPENIHLNSFMYEPILDMSALHLYDLYKKVKQMS